VHAYLGQFNEAAAERVTTAIMERVELLKAVPKLGAVYPKGLQGPYRVIISGRYRIFYRVLESSHRIDILLVWHGARQEPDLPP
jgi:plasmid stabilization system protein ParE